MSGTTGCFPRSLDAFGVIMPLVGWRNDLWFDYTVAFRLDTALWAMGFTLSAIWLLPISLSPAENSTLTADY